MIRRKKQDIHINQERWLVSYADFITLLFAFFVVMYSVSQVNQSKYRVLSETFVQAFNPSDDSTIQAELKEKINSDITPPVNLNNETKKISPINDDKRIKKDATAKDEVSLQSENKGDLKSDISVAGSEDIKKITLMVSDKFAQLINDQMIKISSNEFWLQIELSDSILFTSASADPSPQAQAIFTEIASILKNFKNPVQVEGFTDNVPISNGHYPTNWELSSARATAIVKWLALNGVEPGRLSAVGHGEFKPVASNDTEKGRAQNRRVDIMIAKRKMERPQLPVNLLK